MNEIVNRLPVKMIFIYSIATDKDSWQDNWINTRKYFYLRWLPHKYRDILDDTVHFLCVLWVT